METKVYFPNSKGDKMCGILSNPTGDKTKPIIIMLHGFTSSKKTKKMVALQQVFDAHGVSSLRFDAYGHGESDGDFEDITVTEAVDDILQAIRYLKEQGYTKIGLIGSSFGGLASLMAAAKTHDLFVLGLNAPVSDNEEVQRVNRTEEGIAEWKHRGFTFAKRTNGEKLKLNYTYFEDMKNNIAYTVADKIHIPTIIVHGDADTTVPLEQSKKTAKLIPNCKLVVMHGADHLYTDEKLFDEMIQTLSEFILQHV